MNIPVTVYEEVHEGDQVVGRKGCYLVNSCGQLYLVSVIGGKEHDSKI